MRLKKLRSEQSQQPKLRRGCKQRMLRPALEALEERHLLAVLTGDMTSGELTFDDSLVIDGDITLTATSGDVVVSGTITGNDDGSDDAVG